MKHTEDLQKMLRGFELYILPVYENVMEEERKEDAEYNSGIMYHDDKSSFYSWLDSLSWSEMKPLIEEYKEWGALQEYNNHREDYGEPYRNVVKSDKTVELKPNFIP